MPVGKNAKMNKNRLKKGGQIHNDPKAAARQRFLITLGTFEEGLMKIAINQPNKMPSDCISDAITAFNKLRLEPRVRNQVISFVFKNRKNLILRLKQRRTESKPPEKRFLEKLERLRILNPNTVLAAIEADKMIRATFAGKVNPFPGDVAGMLNPIGAEYGLTQREVTKISSIFVEYDHSIGGYRFRSEYRRLSTGKPKPLLRNKPAKPARKQGNDYFDKNGKPKY